jgi:hypothetical protein
MNNMKPIKVWAIYTTTNEWGNKGGLVIVTDSEVEADKHNEGVGWYGGQGHKEERLAIRIGNSPIHFFLIDGEVDYPIKLNEKMGLAESKIKKNALKKLTDVEKAVLGLGDE